MLVTDLDMVRDTWEMHSQRDPLWGVCMDPEKTNNRWTPEEIFEHGRVEMAAAMRTLDGLVPYRRHDRALDFGCGVGRCTEALADFYEHVYGVDIAPGYIAEAKRLSTHPRCHYDLNETADLAVFADDIFDFAYSANVFQHMPVEAVAAYIPEIIRVLRPDGVAMLEIKQCDFPLPSPSVIEGWFTDAGAEMMRSFEAGLVNMFVATLR